MKKIITKEEVEKVARLARIRLSDEEKEIFTAQLEKILEYVEKLKELNVEGVEPTSHVLPLKNVFREDVVKKSLSQEDALKNAPESKNGYFKVPKIIER